MARDAAARRLRWLEEKLRDLVTELNGDAAHIAANLREGAEGQAVGREAARTAERLAGILGARGGDAGDPPLVLVTNFDLINILAGRLMNLGVAGGGSVMVRLATPEELIASVDAAQEPGTPRMPMGLDQAVGLCQPFDIEAMVRGRV